LGILTPGPLSDWPEGQLFDLATVYEELADSGRLAGYEVTKRFYEIGSMEGLQEADTLLRASNESL
jgi:NDP-sugar pyrophosphorylase family protein